MSRDIEVGMMDQFRAGELTPVCLFKFTDGDTTYRYCDLDVPLNTEHTSYSGIDIGDNSGLYSPLGFKFDSIKYSLGNIVDQANITIDNRDQVMTSIFVAGIIQGEESSLSVAVLDSAGELMGAQTIFKGEIDSWELHEEEVRITLSTPFARWAQQTTSLHSSSCRWKEFKGTECQYSGAETICDRSFTRCTILGNTQHFGGFRFLPDFENRQLAWGPNVETTTTTTTTTVKA